MFRSQRFCLVMMFTFCLCAGRAPHRRVCVPPHVPGGGASGWHSQPQPMWTQQRPPEVAVHTLLRLMMRLIWVLKESKRALRRSVASRCSTVVNTRLSRGSGRSFGGSFMRGVKQRVSGRAMFLMSFYYISTDLSWVCLLVPEERGHLPSFL